MKTVVFLLEEPSAKALLEGLVPRLFPPDSVMPVFIVFEGKQDLEKKLVRRVRAYADENAHFVVLRDQDSGDCGEVKRKLRELLFQTGRSNTLIRIACRELESWVAGDWHSVAEEFEQPRLANLGTKAKFRNPDRLTKPVTELRQHLVGYQKIDGARRMGLRLDPETNASPSFKTFCSGLKKLCGDETSSFVREG